MNRCFPRRSRHVWVLFLLLVCLVGVYFTYKQLLDSENKIGKHSPNIDHNIDTLHQHLYQKAQHDLNLPHKFGHNDDQNTVRRKGGNAAQMGRLSLRNLENDEDYNTSEDVSKRFITLLTQLSPSNWKSALDAGDMILRVKDMLSDLAIDSRLSCREIDSLRLGSAHELGFYGKKYVDHAMLDSRTEVAIKSLGSDQEFKIKCMKMDYNPSRCESMANYNLLRELLYLLVLDSHSVIKLKGYCLRGETSHPMLTKKGVIIITESGRQISQRMLEKLQWADKLKMSLGVVELLEYMESSPLGSLVFEKLHATDFVRVDSQLRLVDLDNIAVGEHVCKSTKDCVLKDMPRKKIVCVKGRCHGWNSLHNLLLVFRILIDPMLRTPPAPITNEVRQFLINIQNLNLDVQDVMKKLKELIENDKLTHHREEVLAHVDPGPKIQPHKIPPPKVQVFFPAGDDNQDVSYNDDSEEEPGVVNVNGTNSNYTRYDRSNYPGIFDYTCDVSRVSWGCVVSIKSLQEGFAICDGDDTCRSFVVFSANPEIDGLMTMVLKNNAVGKPEPNYGATLFVRKRNQENGNRKHVPNSGEITKGELDVTTLHACVRKSQNQTERARFSRERRLMTHLGLKGVRDNDWTVTMKSTSIAKHHDTSPLSMETTHGGNYRVTMGSNALGLTKATFLVEYGPVQHHIAFIVGYFVDRVLGLYHVPPAVGRKLSVSEFQGVQGAMSWFNSLGAYTQSDGSGLMGVMSMPVPPVMKTSSLTIVNRETVVSEVVPFSRDEKAQLEYLLLLYLLKMKHPRHGYLGYKGHLIHFESDLAFQSLQLSMLGYFYNCQFPNAVYKTLVCYKCPHSDKMLQICGFGEEVIKRTIKSGFQKDEVKVGTYSFRDLQQILNNGASSVLTIVDHCIKLFSREKVLY